MDHLIPPRFLILFGAVTLASSEVHASPVRFAVDFPLSQSIGPLRAGQLCMPRGALRGTDLVRDDREFALLVRQTLDDRASRGLPSFGDGAAPLIELHLHSANVKLCAKSWGMFGMGDTKSLSGDADFTFTWRLASGGRSLNVEKVELRPKSKDRVTGPMILRLALENVLERAAKSALVQ